MPRKEHVAHLQEKLERPNGRSRSYDHEVRTSAAVARRTTGSTSSSVGNATTQDSSQALSQMRMKCGTTPTLRNVLITETMHVIRMDSSNGMTTAA